MIIDFYLKIEKVKIQFFKISLSPPSRGCFLGTERFLRNEGSII
jgi:hypothetical protein